MRRRPMNGQSTTEFLLVSVALALALFYPYLGGESVTSLLLRSLVRAMRVRAYLVSIL